MISVSKLKKSYGSNAAVCDLSFRVPKGCVFGFLGENGAGKTTTLSILTGCLAPDGGKVLIGGRDIVKNPNEAKKLIGYLPETPPLYPDMTPLEFLTFVAGAKGIKKKETDVFLKKAIDSAGLKGMLHRLIKNLSKGYRQRVGLAAAILGEPEVLILDEPTSGLDPKQLAETRSLIKDYAKEHTVIVSSHVLSEIELICDKVLIISHGRQAALDSPENLRQMLNGQKKITLTVKCGAKEAESILSDLSDDYKFQITHSPIGCSINATYTGINDPREELFIAFSRAETPILEMQTQKNTLEEVFLALTPKEDEK